MLGRLAGAFAVLFGMFYLAEGAGWLQRFASGATSRDLFWFHYQSAVILFDFVVGGGATLAGAGMLLRMDWGRKVWLGLLLLTVLLHGLLTFANLTAGINLSAPGGWVLMVVTVTLISWVLLTRPFARARFR